MGYYTRVLSQSPDCPPFDQLERKLYEKWPGMILSVEDGSPTEWTSLLLSHSDGVEVAAIERNPVAPGTLGEEELAEFLTEVEGAQPATAVPWLMQFLKSVRAIYACQHLSGTQRDRGDEALRTVSDAIWCHGDAIFQADGEGFSNDDGYHILWQFSENVSGPWWMAVLQGDKWVGFQMELGNAEHRKAFLQGQVPNGARTA